jgi:hypothetical protein
VLLFSEFPSARDEKYFFLLLTVWDNRKELTVLLTAAKGFERPQRGCQIFLGPNIPQTIPNYRKLYQITTNYTKLPQTIPNYHKLYQITTNYTKLPQTIYQITIKYTKWTYNIPNGHKINQHFPFQVSLKYTQIVKFGMKINHLATLGVNTTVNFSTIVEA